MPNPQPQRRSLFRANLLWILPLLFSAYLPFDSNCGLSFEVREIHLKDISMRHPHQGDSKHSRTCIGHGNTSTLLQNPFGLPSRLSGLLLSLVQRPRNVIIGAWGNEPQFSRFCSALRDTLSCEKMRLFTAHKPSDFSRLVLELDRENSESNLHCAVIVVPDIDTIPSSFHPLFKSIIDQSTLNGRPLSFQVMFVCHFLKDTPISDAEAFEASKKFPGFQYRVLHLMNHISLA